MQITRQYDYDIVECACIVHACPFKNEYVHHQNYIHHKVVQQRTLDALQGHNLKQVCRDHLL